MYHCFWIFITASDPDIVVSHSLFIGTFEETDLCRDKVSMFMQFKWNVGKLQTQLGD